MIPIHQHLSEDLYRQTRRESITAEQPALLVTDHVKYFLNLTLHYAFKSRRVAHLTHNLSHQPHHHRQHKQPPETAKSPEVFMNAPCICFADTLLSDTELIDFVCDMCLAENLSNSEFIQRKHSIKEIYKIWKAVFQWESKSTISVQDLQKISVASQQDYQNVVFQQLQTLVAQGIGRVLHKRYKNYGAGLELEEVFYADIVGTILKTAPKSAPDHLLRGYFHQLIEFAERVEEKVENIQMGESTELRVFLLRGEGFKDEKQYKKWTLNWKPFLGLISVAGAIYGFFVK